LLIFCKNNCHAKPLCDAIQVCFEIISQLYRPFICTRKINNASLCFDNYVRKTALDMLLDPTMQNVVTETFEILKQKYKDQYQKFDLTYSYKHLMSLLWHSTLPCFDLQDITAKKNGQKGILKYCKWKGLPIRCSEIFVAFPTDNGICCAFNIKSANKIFSRNSYSEMVSTFQENDKNTAFDAESARAHNDLLSAGTSNSEVDGFLGLVGARGSFPFFGHEGFNIKPGHVNYIGLSATRIEADDSLRNLDPGSRNCRFPEENEILQLHKTYSFANCMFECSIFNANEVIKTNIGLDCIPWYFPSTDSSVVCDPWNAENFRKIMMNDIPNCKHCLQDCTNTAYEPLITSAPFTHCSSRNLGVSYLCKLNDFSLPAPQLFGNDVVQEYESKNKYYTGYVPTAQSSKRNYSHLSRDVFPNSAVYDAIDKDTAIVEIYFR